MSKVYIIAEAGVNHNGDKNLAFKLCDAAKEAGVDAVKFQTWKTEKIVTKSAALAEYQEKNISDKGASQYEMLKQLELSYEEFVEVRDYCYQIGIQFLSTPDTEEDLDFLLGLGIPVLKIGSGEVTNIPYLRIIGSKHQKVIISTGMSTLADVEKAYNTLMDSGAKEVALLHCTTNYPCPYNEVNLQAMQTLKYAFKCQVGYSDHTMGIEVPIAAVAMGAEIIEKHFTLDKNMDGPDHKASLNPEEFKAMVSAIRHVEVAMGDGVRKFSDNENEIKKVARKSIILNDNLKKGEILEKEALSIKRPGTGIAPKYVNDLIGKTVNKDLKSGHVLQWEDLE